MRRFHTTFLRGAGLGLVVATLGLACGARTGLGEPQDATPPDAHHPDVHEAGPDAIDELPMIDVVFPDVPIPSDCPDAGSTLIYVITVQNELYSFYPPTLAFNKIGTVACPSPSQPFSMGVNRLGVAYTVFSDGNLFQLSTANAACKATPFVPNQANFSTFGMGYVGAPDGGDTLYVANDTEGLGTIDTKTFVLKPVAPFTPTLPRCELTGTGDGRLFAFCVPFTGTGGTIAQIDPATAKVVAANKLTVGAANEAFAYAFWGEQFWIFTAPSATSPSTVTRYDPLTQGEATVASFASTIVGAGVSTCAPQ